MAVPHHKTIQPLASRTGRVLLVDDDPEILDILELYLEAQDLQCQKAMSGQEALLKASSFHPDLFVLDAFMPSMTGFQVSRELRQCSEFQQTPILFLSSNEEEEHMINAYQSGADDYMTKPFNPKTLGIKIKKAVERQLQLRPLRELVVGQLVVDQFLLLRELGRGGAGKVYLVENIKDGTHHALKTLANGRQSVQDNLSLQREIDALAKIRHPHVTKIVANCLSHRPPFYVMPYYANGSLADRLEHEGALPIHTALAITAQIADGLHEAHQHGILHRDLKTDNILFDQDNLPVITDFGLAMSLQHNETRTTQTGTYSGTPMYMSPDQIDHRDSLDARSDIFSLGLLLFEMLTGQSPFLGMIASEIMVKLTTETVPSPRQWRPEIPQDVEELCRRALHTRREYRTPNAHQLMMECHRALQELNAW